MKRICFFLILMFFNFSFMVANESVKELIRNGELKSAINACDEILKHADKKSKDYVIADSLKQIAQRIYIDFSKNEAITDSILNKRIGAFTPEQKTIWENNKWLEYRILDGKKLYFKNAVGNLILRLNRATIISSATSLSSGLPRARRRMSTRPSPSSVVCSQST